MDKKRSYTRLLIVQAFYWLLFVDSGLSNAVLLAEILKLHEKEKVKKSPRYDEGLFDFLLEKFKREKTIIDSVIVQFISKDWSLERMDLMLLSIIRAGVCELIYFVDIPMNIIINEYVSLASLFLKSEDINFVNAMLCSVAKSLRDSENQDKKLIELVKPNTGNFQKQLLILTESY